MFENGDVDRGDNARFVLALLSQRGMVTFDDRWAERAAADAGALDMMSLLYGTAPGRAVVVSVLILALALFLRSLPLGPRATRATGSRHPGDYVGALADTVVAAGRGRHGYRHFQRTFRRAAAHRLGLPPDVAPNKLVAELASRSGEDADSLQQLLHERVDDAGAAEALRALDALRRRTGI